MVINVCFLKDLNLLVSCHSFCTFPSIQWLGGWGLEIIMTMICDGMLRTLGILNISLNIQSQLMYLSNYFKDLNNSSKSKFDYNP